MKATLKAIAKYRTKALVLFTFSFFTSCLTPIDDDQVALNEGVVVEGLVIDNFIGFSYVQLSRVESQNNTLNQVPLEGATVTIFEDEDTAIDFFEIVPGLHIPSTSFTGNVGSTYSVQIILPSGETITSTEEILNPPVVIDDISFRFFERLDDNSISQAFHDFFVTIERPKTQNYARFSSSGIAETLIQIDPPLPECMGLDCFRPCWSFRSRLNRNSVALINSASLPDEEMVTLYTATEEYDYHLRYYYQVNAYSLSESGFQYWNSLDQQLNAQGSLLDPRLPDLLTNLTLTGGNTSVFGYFGASAVTSDGIVFRRGETGGFAVPTPVVDTYDCAAAWEGGINGLGFTPDQFQE